MPGNLLALPVDGVYVFGFRGGTEASSRRILMRAEMGGGKIRDRDEE